ncbi:septum formation initiator family protein [bacterium]|nr:septum formation initiator family protein [bacterium]
MGRILQRGYYEIPGLSQKKRVRFRIKGLLIYLGHTLLIVSLIFFYLWQHLRIKELGYELGKKEKERKALMDRNREIEIKVSRLRSLGRIEEIARSRLGLELSKEGEIILLDITPLREKQGEVRK